MLVLFVATHVNDKVAIPVRVQDASLQLYELGNATGCTNINVEGVFAEIFRRQFLCLFSRFDVPSKQLVHSHVVSGAGRGRHFRLKCVADIDHVLSVGCKNDDGWDVVASTALLIL